MRNPLALRINYPAALKAACKARDLALASWRDTNAEEHFKEYVKYRNLVNFILVRVRRRKDFPASSLTNDSNS